MRGNNARPDFVDGIRIAASISEVSGFVVNRFSGNGIVLVGVGQVGVWGNYIGTNADATAPAGNALAGVLISASSLCNVGGSLLSDANVISGNLVGIELNRGSQLNGVLNNRIGTNMGGTAQLGNRLAGILVTDGTANYISGKNEVAFNQSAGILLLAGVNNTVVENRIHDNGGLGIDIAPTGPNPDDPLDADGGPNNSLNAPTLQSARTVGHTTTIDGTLKSAANSPYLIDVYRSPACDPSGYGEGQDLVQRDIRVSADGSGVARFQVSVPALSTGTVITAIASTDGDAFTNSDSSEFSNCIAVAQPDISLAATGPFVTTEAGGGAAFSFQLSARPTSDVTFPVSSSNTREGTVAPSSVTFTAANWNTPQTISVVGVDDAIFDGDAAYNVVIGKPTTTDQGYQALGPWSLSFVNQDNESRPAVSIADASVSEGNSASTTLTFTVTLAPASARPLVVQYATANGSASAPGDFAATAGSLTFAPGETSKTVAVTINGDTTVEPDETLTVTLSFGSTVSDAVLGRATATGTIKNDDVPPQATACAPRPNPVIQSSHVGPGRLQVSVTAQTSAEFPANTLQRLDFGAATNARIEIPNAAPGAPGGPALTPGGPAGTAVGFALTLPPATQTTTFVVQRQQSGPFRVEYGVFDGCQDAGPFRTFVGGGAGVP